MNGKGSVAREWVWWYSRRADGQRRVNAPVRGKKKNETQSVECESGRDQCDWEGRETGE